MKHILLLVIFMISGCVTTEIRSPTEPVQDAETQETSNRLTHGQVQLTLKKE